MVMLNANLSQLQLKFSFHNKIVNFTGTKRTMRAIEGLQTIIHEIYDKFDNTGL